MLVIQEQESKLAELKLQQEQRAIQWTKLQSEIAAEQIRREVLEQLAREEIRATDVMKQPTARAPSSILISPRTESNAQGTNAVSAFNEPARLR